MNMNLRIVFGVVGGLATGTLLIVLGVTYAFGAYGHYRPTAAERWGEFLAELFVEPPLVSGTTFLFVALNGTLLGCVKAVAGPPAFWVNTPRHLLFSTGIAIGLMVVLLVPFLCFLS